MPNINKLAALTTIAEPIKHRALSVYPLKVSKATIANYLVLDEALETGTFRITEVSESGSVPSLLAINETSSSVLLLDGEELIGAKQNRVLNLSVMVAAGSTTKIPVSCVEAGRWRTESNEFQSVDRVQFARARAQKLSQVSRSLDSTNEAVSDQCAVWDTITAKSSRMRVSSPTGAMAAIYESRKNELKNYITAIPAADEQVGAVFAIGNSIVGLELFDAHTTYRSLAPKLVASYALDAMEQTESAELPSFSELQAFIDTLRLAPRHRFMTVGVGETVRLETVSLVGAALEMADHCVHLSAFNRRACEDQNTSPGPRDARMQRSSVRARRL